MDTLNEDHSGSSMEENIDSGLTADSKTSRSVHVLSKSDARYWLETGRLFKNHGSAEYSCRFTALRRREHVNLGTPNKKSAAAKAAALYSLIQSNGWEAALAHYKPKPQERTDGTTVGAFIDAACRISTARRQSLNTYTKAFRKIVSEVKEIPPGRKHDVHGGGSTEWRKKIDAIELESITPADVVAWKNRRLRDAEDDPLVKRRAVVTVNSLIRNAKTLFGKKILPFIEQEITVPRPLPFEGVTLEKAPSMRYVSKIDPYALLATAKEELANSSPEGFKVMVLALVCGLRRSEIDNLLWRAFDFPNSALRVESSEFHELKSEDSAGVIDLDADTLALFRTCREKNPKAKFVIESHNPPRNKMKTRGYRCDGVFNGLLTWLRTQGVDPSKPLHTLRKEIGSIIASEHGIFEASRYLRHSDIRITSAIYADKKKTITPKTFAGLLGSQTTDVPPSQDGASSEK